MLGVEKHLPRDHDFVCLSDVPVPCRRIPLEHDWPRWWSKLELFRPGLFDGPVLYMDLDTLPVGDLSEIASYRGELAMLSDFYREPYAQSGVMAFTPGPRTEAIWEAWIKAPERHMKAHRGDGEWLHSVVGTVDRLQEIYPDQIVSLKVHAHPMKAKGPPEGARLCAGHGRPRFNDPAAGWAHAAWTARAA